MALASTEMDDAPRHAAKPKLFRRRSREVVVPHPGGPFKVARDDFETSVELAPLWIHAGWIAVVWQYRRTKIGAFWHTLGLAGFVLVMGVVWSTVLKQEPVQYFRFVGTGMVVWSMVASFITDGTSIFIAGQSTALSMRYPYLAYGLAHVWRKLLLFAHHFVLIIAIFILTLKVPNAAVLLVIPGLLLISLNGVWLSTLVAMMCLRRRDLIPAISTAMQIAIFVTPVFWPKGLLGEALGFAADFNPLFHLLQIAREPLLGNVPAAVHYYWVAGMLVVGTIVTAWLYGRYRDRFAYWY